MNNAFTCAGSEAWSPDRRIWSASTTLLATNIARPRQPVAVSHNNRDNNTAVAQTVAVGGDVGRARKRGRKRTRWIIGDIYNPRRTASCLPAGVLQLSQRGCNASQSGSDISMRQPAGRRSHKFNGLTARWRYRRPTVRNQPQHRTSFTECGLYRLIRDAARHCDGGAIGKPTDAIDSACAYGFSPETVQGRILSQKSWHNSIVR